MRRDLLALLDAGELTEDDDADLADVEVQREAERAVLELEQLVGHGRGQALDVGDAVAGVGDAADLFARRPCRARRTDTKLSSASRISSGRIESSVISDLFSSVTAPAGAEVCGRSCVCSCCLVCRVAGVSRRAAARPRRAGAGRCRRRPRHRSATRMPPTTVGVDDDVELDRLAVDAPAARCGEPVRAGPRSSGAAAVTTAVSCSRRLAASREVLLEDAGRTATARGAAPPAGPGATRLRRRPCPRAGRPTSVGLVLRRRRCGRSSASRRPGLPATIRSKRNSSSSTWSPRPPALGGGEHGLDGEALEGVAQVALGRSSAGRRARRRGRRRPAPTLPPKSARDEAALGRRRHATGRSTARRSAALLSTTAVDARTGPRPSGCQSAPAGEARRRGQRCAALGERAADEPRIRRSRPAGALTFSGWISPASSSARKRSTMPLWRASSSQRLARRSGRPGRWTRRPTSARSETTACWRSASICVWPPR